MNDLQVYIADMMELFGQQDPQGAAERIVALETKLAENFWDRVRNRDPQATYNKVSRGELERTLSNFAMSSRQCAL